MLADYHIHTNSSDDSKVTMEEYANRAVELGFDEICFTDHVEYAAKSPIVKGEVDYYGRYKNLIENFDKNLSIKFGAEFGVQRDNVEFFKEFFKQYPFDFVLLSCHTIGGLELYDGTFQEGRTQKEYNEAYYNELLEVVKNFKNYSVLAHVDLIRRYDKSYYSLEHTYPIVSEILKQAIKDGKGIEINTSSFQYKIPDLTPSVDIIKLYKELGGEIITIGSDSHTLNRLGNNILDIHQKLRELGFDSFYTFDKMTPIRHELSVLAELA